MFPGTLAETKVLLIKAICPISHPPCSVTARLSGSSDVMLPKVASTTECYQVLIFILAPMTSKYLVMDFQSLHAPAELASPRIAFKDSESQLLRKRGISLRVPPHFAPGSQLRSALFVLST